MCFLWKLLSRCLKVKYFVSTWYFDRIVTLKDDNGLIKLHTLQIVLHLYTLDKHPIKCHWHGYFLSFNRFKTIQRFLFGHSLLFKLLTFGKLYFWIVLNYYLETPLFSFWKNLSNIKWFFSLFKRILKKINATLFKLQLQKLYDHLNSCLLLDLHFSFFLINCFCSLQLQFLIKNINLFHLTDKYSINVNFCFQIK